jgi:hypothetical protein
MQLKTRLSKANRFAPTSASRLAWAVDLAQTEPDALSTPAALKRAEQALSLFCLLEGGSLPSIRASRAGTLVTLINHQLPSMFKQILDTYLGGRCQIDAASLTLEIINTKRGPANFRFQGETRDVARWTLGNLLLVEGHRLAHCRYDKCHRIFLKQRRNAIYCSKRCGLLEGTRRFRSREDTVSKRQIYRAIGYAREVAARSDPALAIAGLAHKLKISEKKAEKMIARGK